jgi:predicted ester cyclase
MADEAQEKLLQQRAAKLEDWARDWYQRAVNEYDLSVIDEKALEFFACDNTTLWQVSGIKGNYESYERIHAASPDGHFEINELFPLPSLIEPDKITVWYTFTGTHTGPMVLEGDRGTFEPTGKKIRSGGASMLLIQDWKMIGARAISDMMSELGIAPPPVVASHE